MKANFQINLSNVIDTINLNKKKKDFSLNGAFGIKGKRADVLIGMLNEHIQEEMEVGYNPLTTILGIVLEYAQAREFSDIEVMFLLLSFFHLTGVDQGDKNRRKRNKEMLLELMDLPSDLFEDDEDL